MKILVLGGAGTQGSVICTHLTRNPRIEEVICGELDVDKARNFAKWLGSEKLSIQHIDASRTRDITRFAEEVDVVLNAAMPRFNLNVMTAAFDSGSHYQDLALGPDFSKQRQQSAKWRNAGLTALVHTGHSPGLTNVLARCAADQLDTVERIRIRFWVSMKTKELYSRWQPEVAWLDMTSNARVYENGVLNYVPPFSGEETYSFPDPIGKQSVFHHRHEEVATLPLYIKDVKYVDFKMGSPDMPSINYIVNLHLMSDDDIEVRGIKVSPREVFMKLLPPTIPMEEVKHKVQRGIIVEEIGCDVVEVDGKKAGAETKITSHAFFPGLQDVHERMPGATCTSYMTGVCAATFTEMLANQSIKSRGVFPPECLCASERSTFLTKAGESAIVAYERTERALNEL
jgi:saccharopine dehydrogenase (NAD+, L-lysine-forming)